MLQDWLVEVGQVNTSKRIGGALPAPFFHLLSRRHQRGDSRRLQNLWPVDRCVVIKSLTDVPLVGAPFDTIGSFRAVLGAWIEFLIRQEHYERLERNLGMLSHNIDCLAVEVPIVEQFVISFEPRIEVFSVCRTDDHKVAILLAKEPKQLSGKGARLG